MEVVASCREEKMHIYIIRSGNMRAPVWVICKVNKIVLYSGTKKECINFITKYQSQLPDYDLQVW